MANHPENGDLPKYPTTNVEEYMAKLALDNGADLDTNIPGSHPQNGDLPEYPTTNVEEYLAWFTMNGLGKPTLGYFYEGKFYKDPEHTEEIAPKEGNLYFDVNSGLMYIYVNDEFSLVGSKLYDTTGDNTDGAMTQKATTDEVDRLDTRIDNIELSSDVVDVVATKADLDAYPTAGLKDKDIIKVLADETKEQATSYYRWNKAGSAWVFMASVGPYYTKRETDSLLAGANESYVIRANDWVAMNSAGPYTHGVSITATYIIGDNTVVELLNDQAVAFASYGFAIASISGQKVTIYSVGAPDSDMTLKINYKG